MIERFSGHRRRIIEQDFYASIFLYNLATAIQWDAEKQMYVKKRKPYEEYVYKALFSSIVGIMYVYMEYLLSFDFESINGAVDFLIEQAKRMYHQKNIKKIRQEREKKLMQDLLLQEKWGDNWEKMKPVRTAEDPTNDHPGNPKPTH